MDGGFGTITKLNSIDRVVVEV